MKKLIVLLAFVLVSANAQTNKSDTLVKDSLREEKSNSDHDHDNLESRKRKNNSKSSDKGHDHEEKHGDHDHGKIEEKHDHDDHEKIEGKHDDHNHGQKEEKHDDHDHGKENDKHDDHGHGTEEGKHDDHGHDDHGHGDEEGHAHGSSKAVGEGKAIKELDEEKGISFSKEAMANLKIELKTLTKDSITIPKVSLVYSRVQKAIYVLRDGYFKMVEVSVLKSNKKSYFIKIKNFEKGDKIVMSDVNLIRVSDIYAKDKSEYGHSH